MISSRYLFCLTNNTKSKDITFTVIENREKQQIHQQRFGIFADNQFSKSLLINFL